VEVEEGPKKSYQHLVLLVLQGLLTAVPAGGGGGGA